jgi:hypothetical protein
LCDKSQRQDGFHRNGGKIPHTDVSAEKLARDARVAGLMKLRHAIQGTGQRRLWAVLVE